MKKKVFLFLCATFSFIFLCTLDVASKEIGSKEETRFYNNFKKRMEYVVKSEVVFNILGKPEVIRTIYAYYTLNDREHRVEVINYKREKRNGEDKVWEEVVRTYTEPHSYVKEYTSNYYKRGEYGYYEYNYRCKKCQNLKYGGVDKVYIGPGDFLPLPNKLKEYRR